MKVYTLNSTVTVFILTDIRVDWEMFNTFEGDQKLTDLIVTYGKPFPLRDSDGNEIVPPTESKLNE